MKHKVLAWVLVVLIVSAALAVGSLVGYVLGISQTAPLAEITNPTPTVTQPISNDACIYQYLSTKIEFTVPGGWTCTSYPQTEINPDSPVLASLIMDNPKYTVTIDFEYAIACGEKDPECNTTTVLDTTNIKFQKLTPISAPGSSEVVGFFKNVTVPAVIIVSDQTGKNVTFTPDQITDLQAIFESAKAV